MGLGGEEEEEDWEVLRVVRWRRVEEGRGSAEVGGGVVGEGARELGDGPRDQSRSRSRSGSVWSTGDELEVGAIVLYLARESAPFFLAEQWVEQSRYCH